MKIYVASSWRNYAQPAIVHLLRRCGHDVYDFKNPDVSDSGFHWSEIDPLWKGWSSAEFIKGLDHPVARAGFAKDLDAMLWADAFVLVMPCGRSAHLELGWAVGAGKKTVILLGSGEPELMYKMADHVVSSAGDLFDIFGEPVGE
jgi:hypothetical protein